MVSTQYPHSFLCIHFLIWTIWCWKPWPLWKVPFRVLPGVLSSSIQPAVSQDLSSGALGKLHSQAPYPLPAPDPTSRNQSRKNNGAQPQWTRLRAGPVLGILCLLEQLSWLGDSCSSFHSPFRHLTPQPGYWLCEGLEGPSM